MILLLGEQDTIAGASNVYTVDAFGDAAPARGLAITAQT